VGGVAIESLEVSVYEVPMEEPESDGTLEWDSTTCIVVEVEAGGERGLGYTYGDVSIATMIESKLAAVVEGTDALSPPSAWSAMHVAIRNAGRPGVGAMAISAVDVALWDLKARLLGVPLAGALPRFHDRVPIYGSGGFCSYSDERLQQQMQTWVDMDIPRLKIKVAREPERDPERIRAVREVIGDRALFVDANGAYQRKQALEWAHRFHDEWGITYLEEPVSSEDLAGLRLLRDQGPPGLAIAAGEYSWNLFYSNGLIEGGCVDIIQADVTRVGGITEMLRVDGLAKARSMPSSAHCAPAISAHVCCAMETIEHIEYFHDHVRVEKLLFDGTLDPHEGLLEPDASRPGLGLELKREDAAQYLVPGSERKG
jgi:L-alanine-DL-glutamate epimerase-like enolase superfamily enzyme